MAVSSPDTGLAEGQHVEDFAYHLNTYRAFVRGVIIFTAHVAVILLVLAYVFSGWMG